MILVLIGSVIFPLPGKELRERALDDSERSVHVCTLLKLHEYYPESMSDLRSITARRLKRTAQKMFQFLASTSRSSLTMAELRVKNKHKKLNKGSSGTDSEVLIRTAES